MKIPPYSIIAAGAAAALAATALIIWQMQDPPRENVLRPAGGLDVAVMDFSEPFPLNPPPPGWHHRSFLTRAPGDFRFAEKAGVPALRFATRDSASMLVRYTDIPLEEYPILRWRWYIEQPIESPIDEQTREGDDHPARLFLRFASEDGERRAMEIIWGNERLETGDTKYIDSFPHYVANGGDAGVGQWHRERVDLRSLIAKFWPDWTGEVRLAEIALFCDSDDTDTRSVAYFADVRMQSRQ